MTMRSEYSGDDSPCCAATMHRPAGDPSHAPWFCQSCGTPYDPATGKVARKVCKDCSATLLGCGQPLCEAREVPSWRQVYTRAVATQSATVQMLAAAPKYLHGPFDKGVTVDAGALDTVAAEGCSNDSGHGPGTCVFPDTDGLCPACTIEYLQRHLTDGQHISIDVLL